MIKVVPLLLLCLAIVVTANPVQRDDDDDVIVRERSFDPDRQLVYRLYTRSNPKASQPILNRNVGLLKLISYDSSKRTVILLPGNNEDSKFADAVIPGYLAAADVNVIVVDWRRGYNSVYLTAIRNAISTGDSVASFINWLNGVTGATAGMYHIVGIGYGGHMAGVISRQVEGNVAYITALDPSQYGWIMNSAKLRAHDAAYTEVIHTSAGVLGYMGTLGSVDFYPNGGVSMPGCFGPVCDHERAYQYFAESLTNGGFTGRRCTTYITAMTGSCGLLTRLAMGGIFPKTGSSGIFHLTTNRDPVYSRT